MLGLYATVTVIMPFGNARYGANILGFSNASQGIITVDNTANMNVGDQIIVASLVDSGGPISLNGQYIINGLTGNTITVNQDTSTYSTYVSGGFATIQQYANPAPVNQGNYYHQFVPYAVFNPAK